MLLRDLLADQINVGRLSVTFSDGCTVDYGDGSGPNVAVVLTRRAERDLIIDPDLAFGEAYMDGDLRLADGQLWDLLDLIGRNKLDARQSHSLALKAARGVASVINQHNDRRAARRNIRHHYDLSLNLFRQFLDEDLQYSCAYFSHPDMSLDAAQAAKKVHLEAKLDLNPGQRVLDIGCGWGGLALDMARRFAVQVRGVTLSGEQLAVAQARAKAEGLASRAEFSLTDYRDVEGPFDRIVSVGMLEHVGRPNLTAYFEQVARLLADDGVAVIHAIGNSRAPMDTQPFVRKYIFPGGYIPSLSEVTAAVEKAGLWINDVEILRLHYAETLAHWRKRCVDARAAIVAEYDERFFRMWETYLCMSEMAFRYLNCMVFQLQLTKRVDVLPVTRDYIYQRERRSQIQVVARA